MLCIIGWMRRGSKENRSTGAVHSGAVDFEASQGEGIRERPRIAGTVKAVEEDEDAVGNSVIEGERGLPWADMPATIFGAIICRGSLQSERRERAFSAWHHQRPVSAGDGVAWATHTREKTASQ